jgi:hypothetical protein
MTNSADKPIRSGIVLYQTEDGKTRLEVRLENETVWLTQSQMAELFQTSIPNVGMHIRNIFREGIRKLEITTCDFKLGRHPSRCTLCLYGTRCCNALQRIAERSSHPRQHRNHA